MTSKGRENALVLPSCEADSRGEGWLPTQVRPSSLCAAIHVPAPLANWVWSHDPSPQVSQPLTRACWRVGYTCGPGRYRWGPTARLVLGF